MKKILVCMLLGVSILFISCQQHKPADHSANLEGLTKITILYPNGDGKTFDMDYYSQKHMPMLESLFGDALKAMHIDKGVSGRTPEDSIPYLAIGYLYFDDLATYQKLFGPNAEKIIGDIPNYTNIQPLIQISEVVR